MWQPHKDQVRPFNWLGTLIPGTPNLIWWSGMEDYSPQMKQNRAAKRAAAKNRARQNSLRGNRPTSTANQTRQKDAQINTSRSGQVRVVHSELIKDVYSSIGFKAEQLPVNPGVPSTFPWLSSIAERFESYLFNSLRFKYMHQVSEFTEGNGKVLLAMDYDAADSLPLNKVQLASYQSEVSGAPYENIVMTCKKADLDKFGKQRYIRQGTLAANLDIKTYDVGNIIYAVQAQSVNDKDIGELWVEYDVTLYTPQLNLDPVSAKVVGNNGVSKTAIFGTQPLISGALAIRVTGGGSTLIFDRVGQYIIGLSVNGTVLVDPNITGTATSALSSSAYGVANGCLILQAIVDQPGLTMSIDFLTSGTITGAVAKIGQFQWTLL